MAATDPDAPGVSSSGWDTRLNWLWILYNAVAFVVVLTATAAVAWIGADVLHLDWARGRKLSALLVVTLGALAFGGVLGALQWLVISERGPVPRNRWIVANVGPAYWVGCLSSFPQWPRPRTQAPVSAAPDRV